MLNIFRYHSPNCDHKERSYNRCRCKIWYDWHINGKRIKKPLNTRSWSEAQRMARELETGGIIEQRTAPIVKDAAEAFLNDARARGLRESSIYKLRLLTTRLQEFSTNKGFDFISDYNVERASAFRETWTNRGTAARKKLEALRTFFRFCVDRKWLTENPAKALKMPKNTEPPVEPFTPEEVDKILAAIKDYPDKQNGIRLRALILLLRYSGLRLGDAVTISRDRIEDGTLILRTEKTGTRVRVPLPQEVTDAIAACPGPRFPFWSGNGKRKSVVTNWQRALKTLFDIAEVPGAHAHRYRHTFACEMLMAGVSLTIVAKLLGHASEAITERHYGAWVKGRQEQLEVAVRQAFPSKFAAPTGRKTVERKTAKGKNRQKVNELAGK
jgi:integrase